MAETQCTSEDIPEAIKRACAVIEAHSHVDKIEVSEHIEDCVQVAVYIRNQFPTDWKLNGISPNGVKHIEEVRIEFPLNFPWGRLELSLRPDFSRKLPHIQPWQTKDERPVPCILDGDINELIHQEGISGIISQIVSWLKEAAQGKLIDPEQGWEPVRRDEDWGYIIADSDALRSCVDKRGGHKILRRYYYYSTGNKIYGEIVDLEQFNIKDAKNICEEIQDKSNPNIRYGFGLALVVWPGKKPDGSLIECDEYMPEYVTNMKSLKDRASLYGCGKELNIGLKSLKNCIRECKPSRNFNVVVILCVRRPYKLIGTETKIELCPYFVICNNYEESINDGKTPVLPTGHLDKISPDLLARLSGLDNHKNTNPWVLIGAGSLGSKLAIHMARAGCAPKYIIDNRYIRPHNAARHALTAGWGGEQHQHGKSELLSKAINNFEQKSEPLKCDVVELINDGSLVKKTKLNMVPIAKRIFVNTTASLRVRATLNFAGNDLRARMVESCMYDGGKIGIIATEGPGRNPNLGDLLSHFYARCISDSTLRNSLFGEDARSPERTPIGQGCDSVTMRMSDGRISLYGAALAEYLLSIQSNGLPEDGGELLVGTLDSEGLGVAWHRIKVPPVTKVTKIETGNGEKWSVRISQETADKIKEEVSQYPDVETGGVLMGCQEDASRTFYIVDVLPAPPDSTRSACEFTLGTKGIRLKFKAYAEQTNENLYCLGTWHSHLGSGNPSHTDRCTARAFGLARRRPGIFLVYGQDGFHALLASGDATESP